MSRSLLRAAAGGAAILVSSALAACGGGGADSAAPPAPPAGGTSGPTSAPAASIGRTGVAYVPDTQLSSSAAIGTGFLGLTVVHFEDANGNLLSSPVVTQVPASSSLSSVDVSSDGSTAVAFADEGSQNGTLYDGFAALQSTSPVGAGSVLASDIGAARGGVIAAVPGTTLFVASANSDDQHLLALNGPPPAVAGTIALPAKPSGGTIQPFNPVSALGVSADGRVALARRGLGEVDAYAIAQTPAANGTVSVSFTYTGSSDKGGWQNTPRPAFDPVDASRALLCQGQNAGDLFLYTGLPNAIAVTQGSVAGSCNGVGFAPNGTYAIAATSNGFVTVTGMSGGAVSTSAPVIDSFNGPNGTTLTTANALSARVTPDGKYLIALVGNVIATGGAASSGITSFVLMPVDASGHVGAVAAAINSVPASGDTLVVR